MKKQIVSETKQYQPSFPDALLLDDTPKVNSFNGVTSDGVARAIAGASGEVPAVTESDNGKVLTAIYDEGGPAVEWAEATEVTTASGHFDLGGDVPVKVNYTGTAHTVTDYITLTNPTSTAVGTSLGIVFSTQGNKSLGDDTANLVVNDTIHAKLLGVFYAMDSQPTPGPGITTSTGSITSGTIESQTIVLSGSNPATSFYGNSVLLQFSDLTDGETAESIMTKVSIQHWPEQTVDGYETTIPSADKLVPSSTSTDAGKILTVDAQGAPAWGMLGSVTSIQQVSALPASPDANTLYLIPEA